MSCCSQFVKKIIHIEEKLNKIQFHFFIFQFRSVGGFHILKKLNLHFVLQSLEDCKKWCVLRMEIVYSTLNMLNLS